MRVLAGGLSPPRISKKYGKVWGKISRLQQKYARVAQHDTIEVDQGIHDSWDIRGLKVMMAKMG